MFSQADAYERFMGRWSRELARAFAAFVDVSDAGAVLDVGSGTGALTAALHDAAPNARLIGIDPAAAYVEHAGRQLRDPHVDFRVGDATRLDFPDGAFDAAASALVLNFVPDFERAAREMVRVTKPGGVVAAAVWDYGDGMQMLRFFWDEAAAIDAAARERDEARMPLCREGELASLFGSAGLTEVRGTSLDVQLSFASFDDYWSPFLLGQGPAGICAAALSPADRTALASRLRRRILGDRPDDRPFVMHARAWAARGIVPSG